MNSGRKKQARRPPLPPRQPLIRREPWLGSPLRARRAAGQRRVGLQPPPRRNRVEAESPLCLMTGIGGGCSTTSPTCKSTFHIEMRRSAPNCLTLTTPGRTRESRSPPTCPAPAIPALPAINRGQGRCSCRPSFLSAARIIRLMPRGEALTVDGGKPACRNAAVADNPRTNPSAAGACALGALWHPCPR